MFKLRPAAPITRLVIIIFTIFCGISSPTAEKKRLNLLKEIEETKLAIQHIQKSNDIEFDLNDVRNRLLKGKPSDSSDE